MGPHFSNGSHRREDSATLGSRVHHCATTGEPRGVARKEDVLNDEDELSTFEEEDAIHNRKRGAKRCIDSTTALEDIVRNHRWDGDST